MPAQPTCLSMRVSTSRPSEPVHPYNCSRTLQIAGSHLSTSHPGKRFFQLSKLDRVAVMSQEEQPPAATAAAVDGMKITIGEALEATALSAGDQPVEPSDAAAIEAAEALVAGLDYAVPSAGGLGARARAAADANARAERDEDKTTLGDVLADATVKLAADKEVEREDAARVVGAEVRGKADATARPGGVAASVAAAAGLNRGRQ